jgi:ABC-2 type transport system ATP-binding protein
MRGIGLNVRRGEIFGFLGPNGAGKTTTMSMLCTPAPASAGTAIVAGRDVAGVLRADLQRPKVSRPAMRAS